MQVSTPLIPGRLVQRYKRFLADVALDGGGVVTAHCPNPGAMLGLSTPGLRVWLSYTSDPKRKLAHTPQIVAVDGERPGESVLCGVNTLTPNRLAAEALAAGSIPELAGYARVRAEVRYGAASRVDFLLEDGGDGRRCWLEVKNVHLKRRCGLAEFPDCVAARSLKHLRELQACVEAGDRAVMLFVIQRGDCDRFDAAADLDPAYARGLGEAFRHGVEVLCYDCHVGLEAIQIRRRVAWRAAAETDDGAVHDHG